MRRLIVTATIATAIALVSAAPAWARLKSPCVLISAANAKHALGVTFAASKPEKLGLYQACRYVHGAKAVIVLDRRLTRAAFVKSAKKNPGPVVHVAGIGSDAYSAGGPTLLLWKNGTEVTVLVEGGSSPLRAEKKLGKIAAGRL